jgi:Flp pilus assembly protein TadD
MLDANPSETLRQIAATARAGRLDAAALMVEQARLAGPLDPMLAALGGAIEFHRGQFARALPLLEVAHAAHPDDLTVRANYAEAQFRCGDAHAALALCDEASAHADKSMRLAGLGAHLAQEAGNHVRASALYKLVVQARPEDWSVWNNLGNALSALGDHAEAAVALGRAARLAPDSAPIRLNLGNTLIAAGQSEEAEATLREAAQAFPDDPNPDLSLTALYRAQGRDDDAFMAIAEAARRAPDSAEIQSDYGQEAARRNEYAIGEQAFEAALALNPALGPAFVGLASIYERINRESELDPLRDRAVEQAVDGQSLAYIEALQFKRAGDIDAAFAALERAGDVIVPGRKHHLRGTMLDRLGRHDEAFAEFEAMNFHLRADPSQPIERARMFREAVAQAAALLDKTWIDGWTADPAPPELRTPIFVLGFPRSGTTLLDTMLMADPQVRVLEEEPFIGVAEGELGGIEALPGLSPGQIAAARAAYFERAAEKVGPLDGIQLVDKHPMHLNKATTIRRIFPEARFVLALRHPCDVVLSCFLTNFRANNAMANFLDLGDAARLYDLSFAHWEKACELFALPVGTVVYERLVEDKTRELRPLFEWLGMEWPGDEADHRDAARARGVVRTASYSQVTEPLYKRAAGRWTRYRAQLEPIIPVLKPWIDKFGYSLDDGRHPDWPEPWQAQ